MDFPALKAELAELNANRDELAKILAKRLQPQPGGRVVTGCERRACFRPARHIHRLLHHLTSHRPRSPSLARASAGVATRAPMRLISS